MTQDELIYSISRLAACFKVYLSLRNTTETKNNQVTTLKPKDIPQNLPLRIDTNPSLLVAPTVPSSLAQKASVLAR